MTPVTELKIASGADWRIACGNCGNSFGLHPVIGDWSAETAKTAETAGASKWCSNIKRLGGRRRTGFWPSQTAQTAETPCRARSLLIGVALAEIAEIRRAFAWRISGGRVENDRRKGREGRKPPERRKTQDFARCPEPAETGGNRRKPPANVRRSLKSMSITICPQFCCLTQRCTP